MNITKIEIHLVKHEKGSRNRTRAFVTILIDNKYEFKNIAVMQGDNRLYVQFPRAQNGSKIFRAKSTKIQEELERPIIKEFWRVRKLEDNSIENTNKTCYNNFNECE